jgi:hypothetical protein
VLSKSFEQPKFPDYHGEQIRSYDEALARFGLNPYGLPRYRFAQAGEIIEVKGGVHVEWRPDCPIELRGTPGGERPLSSFTGYKEVKRYPEDDKQGWIIERWTPRTIYGSPEEWNDSRFFVPGTTINRLGPYPYEGKYEWAVGPFHAPPTIGFLLDWITAAEAKAENMDWDTARVVRERYDAVVEENERAERKLTEENAARLRDAMSPILSTSLAAGRWRNEMFERAGFHSHVGN